ncbi:ParA family protein [Lactococcus cremoris]|uniref:ParA family protein n=1 Tax=Lactococcus lactis subsp. cremoris TaxID=1359 RepID=UPI001962B3F5|nr:ParA family protein [Lactococcus cremoris]QRZ33087.1 ParA family protein [Lactococcus cremoris]
MDDNCKVISVINMKGGVGKTTLTKELGYFMSDKKEKKILFIDLDPQSNLTQSFFLNFGLRHSEDLNDQANDTQITEASIQNLFDASVIKDLSLDKVIQSFKTRSGGSFDLIPGTLSTIFLERSSNASNMEKSIYNFIDTHELRKVYDYIFIDCPPTYSVYTVAALLPSDFYLVPVEPGIYSVLGIQMLEKVVSAIKEPNAVFFKEKPLKNLGVVFTRYKDESSYLVDMIIETKKLKEMDIYFFNEHFLNSKKLIDRPDYFISDHDDARLSDSLENIFTEIEERINGL